ncbi:PREDICTED: signal recognition particle 14 kDa protein [Aptenodytes forsteri]|uniref:signal recognition particle 14 kDa protein n=1 Tax=Aptenodytes forsteri TaxID=9233 RepID=UPI0004F43B4D|nr:PREDICTED: signal recognition particle 14 kDa protein [Aptenodytes forsteri]
MEEKEINFPSEKHEVALDQMLLLCVPRSTNLGLTENSPFPESAPQEIQVLRFLTELTRLFQKCRTSGSVFITLKKYDGRTKPVPRKGHVESFEPADNKCLLRATDGKKKISTVVSSKEVNKFQMAYSNLLRANMDGLKKKDKKSKNKKSKATQ